MLLLLLVGVSRSFLYDWTAFIVWLARLLVLSAAVAAAIAVVAVDGNMVVAQDAQGHQ